MPRNRNKSAMAEHQHQHQQQRPSDAMKNMFPEKGPSSSQVLAVITLLPLGGFLLLLAGLTFAGTLIGLAVSTPVFVIFSPVLVPAALTIGLAVAGFLTSGAFGITGLSSLSWIANYLRRTRVPEQLDQVKRRAQETAGHFGQKAREVGQKTKETIQDAGRQEGGRVGDVKS